MGFSKYSVPQWFHGETTMSVYTLFIMVLPVMYSVHILYTWDFILPKYKPNQEYLNGHEANFQPRSTISALVRKCTPTQCPPAQSGTRRLVDGHIALHWRSPMAACRLLPYISNLHPSNCTTVEMVPK